MRGAVSRKPGKNRLPKHPCSQPCEVACPYTTDFCQLQKLESMGLMVGQVAHDLNNVLSILMGNAELAIDEASAAGKPANRLRDILDAVHSATSLCHGLLAYAGRADAVRSEVDLAQLVAQMRQLLQVTVPRNSRLECLVAPDLPHLAGDPNHFRQILLNLVLNAVDALGGEPGSIRIEIDRGQAEDLTRPGSQWLRMRISDTGCGMGPEVQAKLFQPFFSTKGKRGRGLGLTAVRTLVEGMDGTVEVKSAPGKGTIFTLRFPVDLDVQTGVAAAGGETGGGADDAEWAGTGTILLADDEPELRMLGTAMLAREGIRVLTAMDGREAVEIYRNHPGGVDLVFLDAAMPRMDGCEALAEIRRIDPAARVVMISGHAQNDLARQWNGQRPDEVLLKPVSARQLRRVAMRHLGGGAGEKAPPNPEPVRK